ncbi:tRNA (adenosine(37)-N6)-threonylcarbamoyltransferase complex dimerization subunit type 1 TsaB [Neolewinella aurantiaca]|uniref:tRNA (Adenosine(37)-N6)-threonylcarbamoyltransferase complex dimerization subunit type 1 TsaB n=1 Tax=Neolewinella aurantiaca TaxID=2602767 RepID=A0A5C7FGF3_9BACT|nr:tRNA (adenosine(37)-N6)-threonylcarbamoyltransferase complex dimerization subunit type 1 TsaB [Neolewinella aurantiaca]TXF88793.1 tRNA (adenosine(37)-N6)-threonylcarbamoyltransferase complex dimerization subunit type 1 TsaB [Neolewinella aurantiaca]
MIRLLLETATDVCSVAVAKDDLILAEYTAAEVHQHSSHLTLFIQQVMEEAQLSMADLDEVVLSDGPGSYTSLRVGAATAKGLCVALPELKLRVVPTLQALAFACAHNGPVLATIKSRKGEVFGQLFGARQQVQGSVNGTASDATNQSHLLLEPQNIRMTEDGWLEAITAAGDARVTVVGSGAERLRDATEGSNVFNFASPSQCAAQLLLAPALSPDTSRLEDMASYEPFYLNPPFVTKSKKKLLG